MIKTRCIVNNLTQHAISTLEKRPKYRKLNLVQTLDDDKLGVFSLSYYFSTGSSTIKDLFACIYCVWGLHILQDAVNSMHSRSINVCS